MSGRILSSVHVDATPSVVSSPTHVLDDATIALLEREQVAAREQGQREGRAAALDAARAEAAAVVEAMERATARIEATLTAQHDALADALATRVLDATRAVLGREPDDEGRALVSRLTAAVQRVDDPHLVVRVPARRQAMAAEALVGRAGVTVEVDDTLDDDDAVVTGEFSHLDLRVERLLAALADVLAGDQPLGPIAPRDADLDGEGGA